MSKDKKEFKIEYNLVTMNIFSVVYTGILGLILYLMFINNFLTGKFDIAKYMSFENNNFTLFFAIMCLWFVLHEVIHGIFYVIGGAKKKNISYGAALEKGIFYCKCNNYITKKNALLSLMAPFTIIGIITMIISFLLGDFVLLILSIFNIMGACGDLTIMLFFLKMPKDVMFREFGDTSTFLLRTSEDISKKKYFGIKSIKEVELDSIPIDVPEKKVTITKGSKPIIVLFIIVIIIGIISEIFL